MRAKFSGVHPNHTSRSIARFGFHMAPLPSYKKNVQSSIRCRTVLSCAAVVRRLQYSIPLSHDNGIWVWMIGRVIRAMKCHDMLIHAVGPAVSWNCCSERFDPGQFPYLWTQSLVRPAKGSATAAFESTQGAACHNGHPIEQMIVNCMSIDCATLPLLSQDDHSHGRLRNGEERV